MRKLAIFALIIASLILMAVPLVAANGSICEGCRCTIKVIPVGSVETGNPIETTNPADLMIFHTGDGPIKNVWLLIVLNQPTYNVLDQITINGSTFMTKSDFKLVTTSKIPSTSSNPSTGYPGSLCQYEVSAIKDKMDEKGNPIYYGVKFFLSQITKVPKYFTLEVELTSSADLKALIIALGRYDNSYGDFGFNGFDCFHGKDHCCYKPFNACSCFTKSTFVVPEIATLALTASPLCALGLFAIKRRKK